jgi:rhodanese-related sulfurtransferase
MSTDASHGQHSPGFLQIANDARSRVREVSVDDALRAVTGGSARLIDVREDNEWTAGHARGADHLGKGIIERDIEKLAPDMDSELILYCGGGFRSALAADALQRMGYTNVASMAGGWRAWNEAGAPTEGTA